MDKTFDVLNDKALVVFDDRLPVVFKYNGETLRKLSALTKNVNNSETNVNEVSYTSEYNRSLRSLGVSGNTTQKQYQGYQQIGFKDFTNSYTDTDENVLTIECKDGIITLNGKTNKSINVTFDYTNMSNRTLKAGTYTFTTAWVREAGANGVFGNTGGCDCRYVDNVTGENKFLYVAQRTVVTFENSVYLQYMQPYINFNATLEDTKFAIGVFKGDVATADFPPYEAYVGGIPSPNPGQKIPIYSTSESTVTLNTELEASEITYDSNFLYTIAFEHPFSFNGAESLTLSVDSFYTGSAGDMLIVGGDPSNIIGGSGTFDYIAAGDGSRGEVTIHSSDYGDTFYIGIGNTDTGISSDKIEDYRQLAITTPISATGTITTQTGVREIPAYPQEIENANDVVLLSKEYQQVEYIESTGTQYIDTGVFPTIDTVVEISCLNKSNNKFIYGSRTSAPSTDKHCVLFQPSSADIYALFGNSTVVDSNFVFDDNTIYKVKNGKDGCYINDVKIRDYGNASFGYTTLSLYLFAINTPAEDYAERAFVGNIYSCKIYEGKTLVRNFIPCYRKTDNVIGMFELVNGTFYTNQGTGNFNKGIDVSSNVAIKNTLVALHGDNLYNISIVKGATTNINVPDIPRSEQYGSITDGVLHLRYGVYAGGTIWTNAKIRIEKGGKYYVTLDVYASSETVYKRFVARFHNATKKTTTGFLSFNIREADIWQRYKFFITVPDDWVGDAVYLCLMSGGGVEQYNDIPMYAKNIMITYGEPKEYQPYFREEISIPTSVEVEGATVELNMASISIIHSNGNTYTATDYLTLERANGEDKVLYHQNIDKKTVTSDMNMTTYVTNGLRVFILRDTNAKRLNNPILANKYLGYQTVGFLRNKDYGITTDAVYWGTSSGRITIRDTRFETLADFKADLDQNPLVIEYGLAEEITHDITNTDLGNLILDVINKIPYGTIYLEVNSGLSVPITVDYAKWGGDLPEGEE